MIKASNKDERNNESLLEDDIDPKLLYSLSNTDSVDDTGGVMIADSDLRKRYIQESDV